MRCRIHAYASAVFRLLLASGTFCDAFTSTSNLLSRSRSEIDLVKRETSAVPSPISVAPSQYWDGIDGPWSSFPIQIGASNPQNIRVMVSTAGYSVWTVIDKGCPSFYPSTCPSDRGTLFNTAQSSSWKPINYYELGIESNLGFNGSGAFGYDTVTLGWPGSGGPTYDHTVIATYAEPDFYVGIFGVKPVPTNFTEYNDPQPSFLQSLRNTSQIASQAYGYTAGNQYRLNKVFGSLTLGGYDSSRLDESKALSQSMGNDLSRDLVVVVQSIESNATSQKLSSSSFYAFIDSTVAQLWLPMNVCKAFEQAFGLKYDTASSLYLVDAALHQTLLQKNPSVKFTIGSQTSGGPTTQIELPYSAFDLNVSYPALPNAGQSSFYFPLKRAIDDTQYTLGRTFLQEAYIIVDYDRHNFTVAPCTWIPGTPSSLTAIEAPTEAEKKASKMSAKMIAGVACGVVVLIAAAGALFWLIKKKKGSLGFAHRPFDSTSQKGLKTAALESPVSVREINNGFGQNQWGMPLQHQPTPPGASYQHSHHRSELSPDNAISELDTPQSAAMNPYGQPTPYGNGGQGYHGELEGHTPSTAAVSSLRESPYGGLDRGSSVPLPRDIRHPSAYPMSMAGPARTTMAVPARTTTVPRVESEVFEMYAPPPGVPQSNRGTMAMPVELPTVRQSRF